MSIVDRDGEDLLTRHVASRHERRVIPCMARLTQVAVVGGLLVIGSAIAWWVLGLLLASDRGLDLSDEGLYLLAANPPTAHAAWGFPWGWNLRPLFQLVNPFTVPPHSFFQTIFPTARASLLLTLIAGGPPVEVRGAVSAVAQPKSRRTGRQVRRRMGLAVGCWLEGDPSSTIGHPRSNSEPGFLSTRDGVDLIRWERGRK